ILASGAASSAGESRTIPFERLVDARVAVEELRQEERTGKPGPLSHGREDFVRLVAREQNRRQTLADARGRDFDNSEIQRELDRIVHDTKRPELLQDLFCRLG